LRPLIKTRCYNFNVKYFKNIVSNGNICLTREVLISRKFHTLEEEVFFSSRSDVICERHAIQCHEMLKCENELIWIIKFPQKMVSLFRFMHFVNELKFKVYVNSNFEQNFYHFEKKKKSILINLELFLKNQFALKCKLAHQNKKSSVFFMNSSKFITSCI
jgi:hypothetical protein